MRLIRLGLANFRQHADTEIEFRGGLTGIIGPNGAGKTTILEAIAWAIYGAAAARGTNETLRFNRAPGRTAVRVELEFELRGERYRVARTPRNAELFRIEQEEPIAAGINEVTRQLTRRLGMTRQEFFNTYFTGQKELQFLAAMGAAERARFLSQVLGYERLRTAQGLVREERKVLKGQVDELRRSLGDQEATKRGREEAERRLREAMAQLEVAERQQAETASRFAELEPAWRELQKARDQDRELGEELRVAATRLERVAKDQRETEAELEKLDSASDELTGLREQIRPLAGLRIEEEGLRGLAEAASRRSSLERQLGDQRSRVDALSRKLEEQEANSRARADLTAELATREKKHAELEAQREEVTARWQRDRQDVEAQLRILRDQAKALQERIEALREQGPDGVCPTCKRALGSEYDSVLTLVRGQYEEIVQDGKWQAKRLEQLKAEPAEVVAARSAVSGSAAEAERLKKELAEAEYAAKQAESLKSEREAEESRARSLAGELARLPEGYDAKRHEEVLRGLETLASCERQITQLETRLERQPELRRVQAEAGEEERQIRAMIETLEERRRQLAFSDERFQAVGAEFEKARGALDGARLEYQRTRAETDAAREALESARRAEREQRQIARNIAERESEHRRHNELDAALGELRDELNDRVRPELSEIASVFLAEITDGRYNRIEINRDYHVVVLDDGEEKPVISGGEEDLANLVLRLAISQMIADRAGQTLSLLIFDEVFGGLDEQRRESVVRLLQRLQDRFEQVILITHVESIREGMDHVTRVTYDERTGASVVRDESPGASAVDPQVEDLAALVSE